MSEFEKRIDDLKNDYVKLVKKHQDTLRECFELKKTIKKLTNKLKKRR